MTTQLNQLTELTTTSDDDLILIRENSTGIDKKMKAQNIRAKATTKADVGLGNVDNTSDATKNSATATLTNKTLTSPAINTPTIAGGTINNTPIGGTTASTGNFTNLAYTGTLTGGTGVVNLGSGQVYKDAAGNVGIGTTPSAWGSDTRALQIFNQTSLADLQSHMNLSNNAYWNGSQWIYIQSAEAANYYQESGEHVWRTAASGTAGNTIGWNERMRITSNGTVQLPSGSPGIKFGTRNNNLDDYETGTWTPAWLFAGGGSATIGGFSAHYTKIGRLVYASVYCFTSSISSPSGNAFLTGLPFTSNASIDDQSGAIAGKRLFATNMPDLTAVVGINQSQIVFLNNASNASLSLLQGSDFNSAATSNILAVSVTYQV